MNDPVIKTFTFEELQLAPNPRKQLRQESIEEMGQSILEQGIIQPPVSRLVDGKPQIYMGQRRYYGLAWAMSYAEENKLPAKNPEYASRVDELNRVQVIVREISDQKMLEEQWVENLQREGVTPQEEAEGYAVMLAMKDDQGQALYTIDKLAASLGQKPTYISRRLKLKQAPGILLEKVNNGEVAASIAEAIGRIPDPAAREEAAKLVLEPLDQEVPLNYVQTKELIRERFMVKLQSTGFDPEDPELLPVVLDESIGERVCGGACTDCPFRSGNNEELKNEFVSFGGRGKGNASGIDPNLCTKPSCFRDKQTAAWRITKARSEEKGQRVLEGDAAKAVFSGYEGRIANDSKYVDIEDKPGPDDVGWEKYYKAPKWKKLIAKVDVPTVVARNPHTGKVVHLIEKKEAVLAIKEKAKESGSVSLFDGNKKTDKEKAEAKEKRLKEKLDLAVLHEATSELVEAINKRGIDDDMRFSIFRIALERMNADGLEFMGKWLEIEKEKGVYGNAAYTHGIVDHVKACADRGQDITPFIIICIIAPTLKWHGLSSGPFQTLLEAYKVDMEAIRKRCEVVQKAGKPKLEEKDLPKSEEPKETPAGAVRVEIRRISEMVGNLDEAATKEWLIAIQKEAGYSDFAIKDIDQADTVSLQGLLKVVKKAARELGCLEDAKSHEQLATEAIGFPPSKAPLPKKQAKKVATKAPANKAVKSVPEYETVFVIDYDLVTGKASDKEGKPVKVTGVNKEVANKAVKKAAKKVAKKAAKKPAKKGKK